MLGGNMTGHKKIERLVFDKSKNTTYFKDTYFLEVGCNFNSKLE